jgi:NADH dehydrogenase
VASNVVIAGGGFAGASAARELERLLPKQSARLILVNDVNFLLYTPFLPEAAAGTLEPRHVVTPLRDILRRTDLRLGAICEHDAPSRTVTLRTHEGESERLHYDQLLVAVGSVSRSLPIPGLTEHAIGFKSLADAIWLRNHVIETLEHANATEDPERREQLLTYVFVGGGYSGLEALAELQDFAADAMDRYPRARLHGMRWILVEATDRVLPEVPADLAAYAVTELRGRGIEIRLETQLSEAEQTFARLSTGERIPTRTIVWTAGVTPHPSLASLSLPLDERGRVRVDEYMRVERLDGSGRSATAPPSPTPTRGAGGRVLRRRSTRSARGPRSPTTSPPSSASRPARGGSATAPGRRSSISGATRRSARSAR